MSNLLTAIEIVKACKGEKKACLEAIQTELNVTRANASVYLFKANKALAAKASEPEVQVSEVSKPVAVSKPDVEYSAEDYAEYATAMDERANQDLSPMEIGEYFVMMDNLQVFA